MRKLLCRLYDYCRHNGFSRREEDMAIVFVIAWAFGAVLLVVEGIKNLWNWIVP